MLLLGSKWIMRLFLYSLIVSLSPSFLLYPLCLHSVHPAHTLCLSPFHLHPSLPRPVLLLDPTPSSFRTVTLSIHYITYATSSLSFLLSIFPSILLSLSSFLLRPFFLLPFSSLLFSSLPFPSLPSLLTLNPVTFSLFALFLSSYSSSSTTHWVASLLIVFLHYHCHHPFCFNCAPTTLLRALPRQIYSFLSFIHSTLPPSYSHSYSLDSPSLSVIHSYTHSYNTFFTCWLCTVPLVLQRLSLSLVSKHIHRHARHNSNSSLDINNNNLETRSTPFILLFCCFVHTLFSTFSLVCFCFFVLFSFIPFFSFFEPFHTPCSFVPTPWMEGPEWPIEWQSLHSLSFYNRKNLSDIAITLFQAASFPFFILCFVFDFTVKNQFQ